LDFQFDERWTTDNGVLYRETVIEENVQGAYCGDRRSMSTVDVKREGKLVEVRSVFFVLAFPLMWMIGLAAMTASMVRSEDIWVDNPFLWGVGCRMAAEDICAATGIPRTDTSWKDERSVSST
jgi:hypothetical protein